MLTSIKNLMKTYDIVVKTHQSRDCHYAAKHAGNVYIRSNKFLNKISKFNNDFEFREAVLLTSLLSKVCRDKYKHNSEIKGEIMNYIDIFFKDNKYIEAVKIIIENNLISHKEEKNNEKNNEKDKYKKLLKDKRDFIFIRNIVSDADKFEKIEKYSIEKYIKKLIKSDNKIKNSYDLKKKVKKYYINKTKDICSYIRLNIFKKNIKMLKFKLKYNLKNIDWNKYF